MTPREGPTEQPKLISFHNKNTKHADYKDMSQKWSEFRNIGQVTPICLVNLGVSCGGLISTSLDISVCVLDSDIQGGEDDWRSVRSDVFSLVHASYFSDRYG